MAFIKAHLQMPGQVHLRLGRFSVLLFLDDPVWRRLAEFTKSGLSPVSHPLINTSTLAVSKQGIQRFLELTGHEVTVPDVPVSLPDPRPLRSGSKT
jgi:hypothetical protein